jgi:hypothetical protein
VNVGELDQLPIYILTNTKAFNARNEVEVAAPSIELVRSMYFGLKEAFASYSEQFILYYLYTLSPIKEKLTTRNLREMLQGSEVLESKESGADDSHQSEGNLSPCEF